MKMLKYEYAVRPNEKGRLSNVKDVNCHKIVLFFIWYYIIY